MTDPVLLTERSGAVLTVTLNRPEKRNALSHALWVGLRDAVRAAGEDPDMRALVLAGAGPAFCAGADLSDLADDRHPLERMRLVTDVMSWLHELPIPTVAMVTGPAIGAGWNLALCCDLVVATPDATFSQVFARRGLSIDSGGSWLLPRLVGLQQAKRLTFLAETVDAREAHSLGLVTWLCEADEVDAFVSELAQRLAAGPPIALAQTKELLHRNSAATFADALADEARAQTVNLATEDTGHAYRAFRERTEPAFTGRWRHRR